MSSTLGPLRRVLRAALGAGLLAASVGAPAALVTSRAALGGNDLIDWVQLGPDFTQVGPLPAAVTSGGGVAAGVSAGGGDLWRFDEGAGTYAGNFAMGDGLLSTFFTNGPIVVDFGSGVARVGAQLQSNLFGAFIGIISVFDAANVLLESHEFGGTSDGNGDNSAIFMGITRGAADIDRVEFNVRFADPQQNDLSLTINQVSLNVDPVVNPMPAPATGLLLLAAFGAAALRVGRTRSRGK